MGHTSIPKKLCSFFISSNWETLSKNHGKLHTQHTQDTDKELHGDNSKSLITSILSQLVPLKCSADGQSGCISLALPGHKVITQPCNQKIKKTVYIDSQCKHAYKQTISWNISFYKGNWQLFHWFWKKDAHSTAELILDYTKGQWLM